MRQPACSTSAVPVGRRGRCSRRALSISSLNVNTPYLRNQTRRPSTSGCSDWSSACWSEPKPPRRNGAYSFSNQSGFLPLNRGSKSVMTGTTSHLRACSTRISYRASPCSAPHTDVHPQRMQRRRATMTCSGTGFGKGCGHARCRQSAMHP